MSPPGRAGMQPSLAASSSSGGGGEGSSGYGYTGKGAWSVDLFKSGNSYYPLSPPGLPRKIYQSRFQMSAPTLQLAIVPASGGKACFLPLAPPSRDGKAGVKISLRFEVTNRETTAVNVETVTFSFPGSASPSTLVTVGQSIGAGSNWEWINGAANVIYLDAPAPPKVQVSLTCTGFSTPFTATLDLVPFSSPNGYAALRFPFSVVDLGAGEYLQAAAAHWIDGPHGTQVFAHDIGCVGFDPGMGGLSALKPGTTGLANEDFRIYGKPVRAVADGVVDDLEDDRDANVLKKDANNQYLFPTDIPSDKGRGNWVGIRSGDYLVIYDHLQKGSITAALGNSPKGTAVAAGHMLGLAGNTGYAQVPHTHIQCEKSPDRVPWGLPFDELSVLDAALFSPSKPLPWAVADADGVPKSGTLITPRRGWSGWRADLGAGTTTSAPAAVLDSGNHLHVFARGDDLNVWHTFWNGKVWSGWRADLGAGSLTGGPSVIAYSTGDIHVFALGTDHNVWHTFWNGKVWSGWHADLGAGTLTSNPVALLDAQGHLHVLALGSDRNVWHTFWNGKVWSGWHADLGAGTFTTGPTAVLGADGRLHVFGRGDDKNIWHSSWNGQAWSGWHADLGAGTLTSAPCALAYSTGDIHVFALGLDRNVWHTFWNGTVWSGWRSDLGAGAFISDPVTMLDGQGRLHVFAQGDNHNIWHNYWNGRKWRGWKTDLGAGSLTSIPSVVAYATGDVHVFARGEDRNVWHTFWTI